MKKIFSIVCVVVLFSCFLLSHAHARSDNGPIQEISGNVKDVKIKVPESGWSSGYTTIEFDDGRSITFTGVYTGQVFEKDKFCKITYQYTNVPFQQGTYIKNIECKKKTI